MYFFCPITTKLKKKVPVTGQNTSSYSFFQSERSFSSFSLEQILHKNHDDAGQQTGEGNPNTFNKKSHVSQKMTAKLRVLEKTFIL